MSTHKPKLKSKPSPSPTLLTGHFEGPPSFLPQGITDPLIDVVNRNQHVVGHSTIDALRGTSQVFRNNLILNDLEYIQKYFDKHRAREIEWRDVVPYLKTVRNLESAIHRDVEWTKREWAIYHTFYQYAYFKQKSTSEIFRNMLSDVGLHMTDLKKRKDKRA